ncbi:cytochrome c oxidase subunit 3 [Sphingomonas oryzagri]
MSIARATTVGSGASSCSANRAGTEEDARAKPLGIWTFVVADCASFAVLFLVFMTERSQQRTLFSASAAQLDVPLGLTNTLILLTSGWLVARATASAEAGDRDAVVRHLALALPSGAAFGLVKIVEYWRKISAGTTPLSNDFFSYYFVLTGLHFLHYLAGIGVLILLLSKARRQGSVIDQNFRHFLESGAIYWHLVDLLWIFLFPMLYLQGL